jgi:outer membrane protein TolC
MASVRSTAEAYWGLYSARAAAQVIEQVVPLLERVAKIEEERMAAQRSVKADVAKAHSQLRAVRQQAVQARSAIVQSELRLRNLLGIPPSDGYKIVPTSKPQEAPVTIDPVAAMATALDLRPDLQRQQLAIRTREHQLLVARNAGLPQLDVTGVYRMNGVNDDLGSSINQMFGNYYHDWQASVQMSMPLGRRVAAANIRAATLTLTREKALMQQAQHAAAHQINSIAQDAAYTHQLFVEASTRLQANTDWLEGAKIRYENPPPAGDGQDWLLAATNDYLTALRSQADAASDANAYLARYNTLLARLNEANGTILNDFNIQTAEPDAASNVTATN